MSLNPQASRAARALLGWSMRDLAATAAVAIGTVQSFEAGEKTPHGATLAKLVAAFGAHGVEVIGDDDRTGAVLVFSRRDGGR